MFIQVGSQKIAAHRFVLAERCSYFRTVFAESSSAVADTVVVSFDFTTVEQVTSFHHLLTFLYTDTCCLLTAAFRTVQTGAMGISAKARASKTKRKVNAKDPPQTCVKSAVVVDDPVMSLKTMARHFGVTSLVKR